MEGGFFVEWANETEKNSIFHGHALLCALKASTQPNPTQPNPTQKKATQLARPSTLVSLHPTL